MASRGISSALVFAPPRQKLGMGSLLLALIAHGFLVLALTWGVNWHRSTEIVTASAELWSDIPMQAAPPPPIATPAPPPEPITTPVVKEPDIVTEKIKIKPKEKTEPPKKEKAPIEPRKLDISKQPTKNDRQDQLNRLLAPLNASGSGAVSDSGSGPKTAGQKADYDAFIKSIIRPNISYQNPDFDKTPLASDILFDLAPDGTILNPRISKSSGNKDWDAVALRAVERTNIIPRDKNGFRPRDMIVQVKPKSQ